MKLTVRSLRELARKYLGQGYSRLTKAELVERLRVLPEKVRDEVETAATSVRGSARKVADRARTLAPSVGRRAPMLQSAHAVSAGKKGGKGKKETAPAPHPEETAEPSAAPVIPTLSDAQAVRHTRNGQGASATEPEAKGLPGAADASSPAAAESARALKTAASPDLEEPNPAVDEVPTSPRRDAHPVPKPQARQARADAQPGPSSTAAEPRATPRSKRRIRGPRNGQPVTEGFFVTPPSVEARERLSRVESGPRYDEQLGDLPSTYETEGTRALPRDPHTLFVFWSFQGSTLRRAAEGLKNARAVLRVFEGERLVREEPFDVQAPNFYVRDLAAGRTYRVEAYLVGDDGEAIRMGPPSNSVVLPPDGPSSVTTLRFLKVPQGLPLDRLREYVRDGRARLSERDADIEYFSWERFDLPGSAEGLLEKRVLRRQGAQGQGEGGGEQHGGDSSARGSWARNESGSGAGRWPRPRSGRTR